MWLDQQEAEDSGYVARGCDRAGATPASPDAMRGAGGSRPRAGDMKTGTWVELMVKDQWIRAQLTWASPHSTLFMFTSLAGTAHSMSRRTLDRLRAQGSIKIVAERNVVDEALDQVAKAALKNSLDGKAERLMLSCRTRSGIHQARQRGSRVKPGMTARSPSRR